MGRLTAGDRSWQWGILLVAALAFQPALRNTYTFDDVSQVQTIEVPRGALGWLHAAAAPWWPLDRLKNLWRPVTRLTILVQKALTGPVAWPFYAFNILLHAAVALLLFRLARRLGWNAAAAGVGALLFAAHPVHAEAVHQIVGRAELLASLGMLAGLLLLLRFGLDGARAWVLQALCFALALGSKEHAMVYPFLVLLVVATGQGGVRLGTGRFWGLLGMLGLVLGLFFAGKAAVTGGILEPRSWVPYHENPLATMDFARRLPAALGIFGYAASRQVWPAGLAPDYSAWSLPFERGWGWGWSWIGLALAGLTLAWAVRDVRRGGRGWALAAAALASYGLIANGPFTIGVAMAERLWYWPSAPLCLGSGWLLAGAAARLPAERRRLAGLALTALMVLLVGLAWGHGLAWRSPENFARATVDRFPRSWRGHTDMARACYLLKPTPDFAGGYAHAAQAVRLFPDLAYGWAWLGSNAMFLPGRQAEAEAAFARALQLDPTLHEAHRHWANLLESQGRRAEAARQLELYLQAPDLPDRDKVQRRLEALRGSLKRESGP